MIGAKSFTIVSGKDLALRGMSSSADIADGAFSPETDAVNLIAQPGVLNAPAAPTDKSANLTGAIIASCEDPLYLGAHRVFVADNGTYYTCNSAGDLTAKRSDGTNTYVDGFSHMAAFDGAVFATSKETVIKWTVDSAFNASYATFTNSNVPHPIVVFENNIFYGDKNLLLRQSSAGAAPATILTLSTEQTIIALGVDPGSGKILISTTTQMNISDTVPTTNKLHYYDGSANKTARTVRIDDMVTAIYPNGASVFIGYGQNFGLWTGSGIRFLRKLNISFVNTQLPYHARFANIGTTLFIVEKTQVLAYGEVRNGGPKVFYYAYKNNVNSNNISHITNLGSNILAIAFPTTKFYTFDTMSIATTNTQVFYTNKVEFDDEIWLREIWVYYKSSAASNATPGNIYFIDESTTVSSNYSLQNTSGANEYVHKITGISAKLGTLQIRPVMDTGVVGIRKIVIKYDPANV